jgi:PEP-CTERM motif
MVMQVKTPIRGLRHCAIMGAIFFGSAGMAPSAQATVYELVDVKGSTFWGEMTVTGTFDSDGDFDYSVKDYIYSYTFTNATGLTLPSEIPQPGCILAGPCQNLPQPSATLSGGVSGPGIVGFLLDDAGEDFIADGTYIPVPNGSTSPPVPEPSTWIMILLGFAGLAYAGYRSTRKAVSTAA